MVLNCISFLQPYSTVQYRICKANAAWLTSMLLYYVAIWLEQRIHGAKTKVSPQIQQTESNEKSCSRERETIEKERSIVILINLLHKQTKQKLVMWPMTFFNAIIIYLIIMQICATSACIFIPYQGEFLATVKYEMKVIEEECLQTCCVERDCTYVRYDMSVCTIFKEGNEIQNGLSMVYLVHRQLVIPQCSLSAASTAEFQATPRLEDEAIEAEAPIELNYTAFYSIVYQFSNDNLFYFSQDPLDGSTPLNTYFFAKYSQPNCVSIPVFTDEDARKLYLGSTYNGTGYKFMNAYAFTDKCANSTEENYYCVPLPNSSADGIASTDIEIEANQTLYVADIITQEGEYMSNFYNCSEF